VGALQARLAAILTGEAHELTPAPSAATLRTGEVREMPDAVGMATGKHILVVNDTQEILDLFRMILEDEGHRVTALGFAVEDLRRIIDAAPDLVILDLDFDREYLGWQTLQKIKMHRDTEKIPVLVCTAEVRKAQEIQGYLTEKGVGLLLKPFDIDDLVSQVTRLLTDESSLAQPTPAK
jgi:CheY-like chemotaxis protein